jgi:hypothetical protein
MSWMKKRRFREACQARPDARPKSARRVGLHRGCLIVKCLFRNSARVRAYDVTTSRWVTFRVTANIGREEIQRVQSLTTKVRVLSRHQIGFLSPSHTVSPRLRGMSKRFFSQRFSQFSRLVLSHAGSLQRDSDAGRFEGNFCPVSTWDSYPRTEAKVSRMDRLPNRKAGAPC